MSKLFFVFLFVCLLLPTVLATDIAYIVKNPFQPDANIINAIEDKNYSYELIDDSEISSTDFSGYEMILIGDERISGAPVNDYKSLIVNPSYYSGWSGSIGSSVADAPLNAFNLEHTITENMQGKFQAYTSGNVPLYYLTGRKYNTQPVTVKSESTIGRGKFVIATKQEPRRVFFGITGTDYWTQESEQLFKNSLTWVLIGEDNDNDGYYSDTDCDDADPDLWQNFPGYIDSDEDGFGSGNLIEICAGEEFPEGYSLINNDCDDLAFEVNPNATEIPYDGIDQDCEGYDIVDFDEDGYVVDCNFVDGVCDISGGDDCDDSDSEFNPGSENIYKNCKNDKPIIEEIPKIIVKETEIVEIVINAIDPENDSLLYYINDYSRFPLLGPGYTNNVFRWQTDYDDAGNYTFVISVSDKENITSQHVSVEVMGKNQAPFCENIPDLSWNEDEQTTLDLNDYCSDPDGDELEFYLNSTSEDKNITLESSGNSIINFSTTENWNGNDWVIFKISDGKSGVLTNSIALIVFPINDAPVFNGIIEDITWNEDTNLIDYLDLNNYFSDVDGDELVYTAAGNNHISIEINNGLASFYPEKDFYGEEKIIFTGFDSELFDYSHDIDLIVQDANEPPEFQEMNCQKNIDEDQEYYCELNATDFEQDEISFSIIQEDNLNCEIEQEILKYQGDKDYVGSASCLIKVSDESGHSEFLLEVDVLPVNDAPRIINYNPKGTLRLMENAAKEFSITPHDVDGDELQISWMLNSLEVGFKNNYFFKQLKGSYELKAFVSDGNLSDNQNWNIFVGDISDFTCNEVGGYSLNQNQICSGQLLETSDSDTITCCSVEGEPAFSDIKRCSQENENIEIEIKKPRKDDEFKIGETIDVKIKIKNNFKEDLDFDVEIYFYDLTKDDKIEDIEDSIDLDSENYGTLELEFEIPEDLDETHDYAIFAKVIGEDEKYCNQEYAVIDIQREDENIVIEDFKITQTNAICGNYIFAQAEIKNIGSDEQDVYLVIENQDLGIYEKTEEFKLEEYNEDDKTTKTFNLKIPENAAQGEYKIKATVFFDKGDKQYSIEKDLVLDECKKSETKLTEIEKTNLDSYIRPSIKYRNDYMIIYLGMLIISILTSLLIIFYLIYK